MDRTQTIYLISFRPLTSDRGFPFAHPVNASRQVPKRFQLFSFPVWFMTPGSCVFPQLFPRSLPDCPSGVVGPWPLLGGGSKVGSKTRTRGLRVPHDAFLAGLQMAGDNRQLCRRWLAGCIAHRIRSFLFLTGEGSHVRWSVNGGFQFSSLDGGRLHHTLAGL